MEFIYILIEFSSLCSNVFQRLLIIAVNFDVSPYFARYLKLVENITLTDFVGVKLKAERRDADLFETLVNDIKSSLFLCSEKHLLIVSKTVGNYRCDSLGLTCSRRTVENEARTFTCTLDRSKL